jgi:hypothetical protein
MMNMLKNLYADLDEKRLLPVAALLLIALVAVPVVLAKPAGESSPATPSTQNALLGKESAALLGETKAIVILGSDGGFRKHVDRLERKDPFVQQAKPTGGTTGAEGATVGTTGASGTTTTPTNTGSTTTPSGGTESAKLYQWAAKVKFGQIGKTKSQTLTPGEFVPSEQNPVLLFVGADEPGKKAQFLVSAEATSRGDGTCVPSESNCQIVQMRKDDVQFFEVALSADTVITYELDLDQIELKEVKNASSAERSEQFLERLTTRKLQKIRESMRTRRVFKALDDLGF